MSPSVLRTPAPQPTNYVPALLLALLAVLLLVVGVLGFKQMLNGGFGPGTAAATALAASDDDPRRVLLTVNFAGDGLGKIRISPGRKTCHDGCEQPFKPGTEVVVTAHPAPGSEFDGWTAACDGTASCRMFIAEDTVLRATFKVDLPDAAPVCTDDPTLITDPTCLDALGEIEVETVTPKRIGADCSDGVDNDRDGLTDTAQDPNCVTDGSEGGGPPTVAAKRAARRDRTSTTPRATTTTPATTTSQKTTTTETTTTPRAVPPVEECADGRDNDGDGLVDVGADPDCLERDTEG